MKNKTQRGKFNPNLYGKKVNFEIDQIPNLTNKYHKKDTTISQ